jgi:hypothetical protein
MTRWWHSTDFWIVAVLAGALFTHSYGAAISREWTEFRERLDSPAEVVAPPHFDTEPGPRVPQGRQGQRSFTVEREEHPACRPTVVYFRRPVTYWTCH